MDPAQGQKLQRIGCAMMKLGCLLSALVTIPLGILAAIMVL